MAKQNLLLVDADPRSLRVLEVSLRKAGYSVASCENATEALEMVELSEPDLILSDTRLPEMDGFALVEKLRERPEYSEIPLIFLSSDGSVESKVRGLELGVEDYLTKPIYIKEIITRVNLVLQRHERRGLERRSLTKTRFSGSLSEMGLVDLLQTIDISRKTGVLELTNGERSGTVYFSGGRLIHARSGNLTGDRAIYRFLVWSDGEFDLEFRQVTPEAETIQSSTQGLLMEGMRRVDEWGRMLEQLPPLDSIFEVESDELLDRLAEIPDEINNLLRQFDGQRSLMEVVDSANDDDLQTLASISKLYFEGLIVDTGRKAGDEREPVDEEAVVPAAESMLPGRADPDGLLPDAPAIVSESATLSGENAGDRRTVGAERAGTDSAIESADGSATRTENSGKPASLAASAGTPAVLASESDADADDPGSAAGDDEYDSADEESADIQSGDGLMAKKGRSRRRRVKRNAEDSKSNVIQFPAQKTASGEMLAPEPAVREDESGPQTLESNEKVAQAAAGAKAAELEAEAKAAEAAAAEAKVAKAAAEETKAEAEAEAEETKAAAAKAAEEAAEADKTLAAEEAEAAAAAKAADEGDEEAVAKGVPVDDSVSDADASDGAERSEPKKAESKKKAGDSKSGGDSKPAGDSKAESAATIAAATESPKSKSKGKRKKKPRSKSRSTTPAKGKGKDTTSSQTIRAITETGEHAAVASDFFTAPSYESTIEPESWADLEAEPARLSSDDHKARKITLMLVGGLVVALLCFVLWKNFVAVEPVDVSGPARTTLPNIQPMDYQEDYEDSYDDDEELAATEGEGEPVVAVEGAGDLEAAEAEAIEPTEAEVAEVEEAGAEAVEAAPDEAVEPPAPTGDYATLLEEANGLRGRRKEDKLREAIAANPLGAEALTELAWLQLNRGRYPDAREFAERATTVDPTSSKAWITLGAARQSLRDNAGATQAYEACVSQGTGQYVAECRRVLR